MKVEEYYTSMGNSISVILAESLKDKDLTLLSTNHLFLNDLEIWLEILKNRPEIDILKNAVKEYQIAILTCNLGLYQQAFMGLRFFLERTLTAILFSGNEVELNLWKIGERDTYWNEIIADDKGVFSSKFCKAFFPELKNEIAHFLAITKKVYRETSEYVHGNKTVLDKIPSTLQYSNELFNEWNTKADIIKRVLLFAFCLRYLKNISIQEKIKLDTCLSEQFKTVKPIIEEIQNQNA